MTLIKVNFELHLNYPDSTSIKAQAQVLHAFNKSLFDIWL